MALRLHKRDQAAGDKGERHKDRREDDARSGKDDLDVLVVYESSEKIAVQHFLARKEEWA
jgi:hypothetical protein